MFRCNEQYRQAPPAMVEYQGFNRNFNELTREQWDEIGINEAIPIRHEPYTTYTTQWVKGDDLFYREEVVTATVDTERRYSVMRDAKQREIVVRADAVLKATGEEYGEMERQTWEQQYSQAVAYQSDPNADVPMLDAIALSRGMDVATLAGHIVANKTAWEVLAGSIVGQRLAYQDALEAAVTPEDITMIEVEYVIPNA